LLNLLMEERALGELARITARLSATLFVAALFAFAARQRVSTRVAVRLFVAFLAAHAIHFSIVFVLAYAWRELPSSRRVFSDDRSGFALRRSRRGCDPQASSQ
jgi:hypothetical protein